MRTITNAVITGVVMTGHAIRCRILDIEVDNSFMLGLIVCCLILSVSDLWDMVQRIERKKADNKVKRNELREVIKEHDDGTRSAVAVCCVCEKEGTANNPIIIERRMCRSCLPF